MIMKPTVFITGATAGFGEAMAKKFAENNYPLIVTGRRSNRLKELKNTLEKNYGVEVTTLQFDVQKKKEVNDAIRSLPENLKKEIAVLINNAGLAAGLDLFQEGATADWEQMIDTNVKGLLFVTKAIVPFMIANNSGHIINIGSTASKYVYEKGNVYCASKFAVDALTQALRIDLLKHNIKVTGIHPGAAHTEFSIVRFQGDEEKADAVYRGYTPLSAGDIADAVYYCISLPAHVCINSLEISSVSQANPFYINRKPAG